MNEADRFPPPSRRLLVFTWTVLAGLTIVSLVAALLDGDAASVQMLAIAQVGVILAVTWLKARQILHIYLNLRTSTAGWRALFGTFVLVILVIVFGAHLILSLAA